MQANLPMQQRRSQLPQSAATAAERRPRLFFLSGYRCVCASLGAHRAASRIKCAMQEAGAIKMAQIFHSVAYCCGILHRIVIACCTALSNPKLACFTEGALCAAEGCAQIQTPHQK